MNWSSLDLGWYWIVGAALLAGLELLVPGVFLIWIAFACVVTAIAAFAGANLSIQLVVLGVMSVVMVLTARRSQRTERPSSDPLLNDRAGRLIGQPVTVIDPIVNGEGRVKVGDSMWAARGDDAPAGTIVRIVGVEGSTLRVVAVAPGLPG